MINVYRETEVSLANFQEHPRHAARAAARAIPCAVGELTRPRVRGRHLHAPDGHARRRSPDVSFELRRGETVAFVGPSGSGKTTLVKLLVGLYRPQGGRILYNGTPHDRVDLDGLRERIGFVTQDTQLFSGTIRENLLFVRPDATRRRVPGGAPAGGLRQPCSRAPTRGSTR